MDKKLNAIIADSLLNNWELKAFSNYEGRSYEYKKVAKLIILFHRFFEKAGIKQGDKIALLGRNSSQWGISYLSIITYGAVVVPILPDFKSDDIHYIINHSEANLLVIANALLAQVDAEKIEKVNAFISLDSFEVIMERNGNALTEMSQQAINNSDNLEISKNDVNIKTFEDDNLALISYTSGTTGFSKGVMISRRNLVSNILYAQENMPLDAGDRICSFLPMAHMYGQLFEFLFPFTLGCHNTMLDKMPSPQVILKAFNEVKPRLILSVPLVIEKIYKKQIAPAISKPGIKLMLRIPLLNKLVHRKINRKLTDSFGGNFREIVIGGAPLNREIEDFLRKIKFRFTIGYGMTECAPLLSYAAWNVTRPYSAGKLVDRMEVRIDSGDPFKTVGEILVRGENVMLGYYKDPESTKKAIDSEGWLHTGDLGVIDANNYIYIRGRSKNMLLGSNGKNIYPEEIESKINNLPAVLESLVVQRNEQIVALIYFDDEPAKQAGINGKNEAERLEELRKSVNATLPKYMHVHKFIRQREEFEKTPKKNIKRFKYQG